MKSLHTFLENIKLEKNLAMELGDFTDTFYTKKLIKKKNGKYRELNIPDKKLKVVQKLIYREIVKDIEFTGYVQGGIAKRSIVTNARKHTRKKYVLTYDIKDFFPNCSKWKVERYFRKSLSFSPELQSWLTRIVTHEFCLPQGAPTSPLISNLLLERLDKRINALCEKKRCTYSRYYDDITISGGDSAREIFFSKVIEKSVKSEGFSINQAKTRIFSQEDEQLVNGLIVNDEIKIRSDFMGEVEIMVSEDENYLLEKELESMKGKISFIKSVSPAIGQKLEEKMKKRMRELNA